jgi:hypothetical protein
MTDDFDEIKRALSGQTITGFSVVWDYIEIIFNKKILRIFATSSVIENGGEQDLLNLSLNVVVKSFIGKAVEEMRVTENKIFIKLPSVEIVVERRKSIDKETLQFVDTDVHGPSLIVC